MFGRNGTSSGTIATNQQPRNSRWAKRFRPAAAVTLSAMALFASTGIAAAASGTGGYSQAAAICDMSKFTRQISVPPPAVTAVDSTNYTDTNYIRYWERLYDANTGQIIVDWVDGGKTTSTDVTAGAFPLSGYAYGTPYGIRFSLSGSASVRIQTFVAWYSTNWSLLATAVWTISYFNVYGLQFGYGSTYLGTKSACG